MRNIKVGNFIRTNNGHIEELIRIERDDIDTSLKWYVFNDGKNERYVNKPYITNYSKNIIDLIEVGDVIEYQVNSLSELKVGRVKKYRDARNSKEYLGVEGFDITKIYIKSILTHEQYEQNCYKVSNDRTQ